MTEHEERTVRVVKGGVKSLSDALAWAMNTYDAEFAEATMVRMEIEQYVVISDDPDEAEHQWIAVVSGLVSEK